MTDSPKTTAILRPAFPKPDNPNDGRPTSDRPPPPRSQTAPVRSTSVGAALDAAFDLSTWAACINWRARDGDNTGEWLDELREKIEATQAAIAVARKEIANGR